MDDGFSKSIYGNNADKLRWDILRIAGWCRFPIMVAWQSGRMRRTVNPLVKFNSPQLFKSIRHHFSHDESWWVHGCMSEMYSLYSSCCSMRWRTGHSDSPGSILKPPLCRLNPAGAAEGQSHWSHHVNIASIAQLDSALVYGTRGSGFESRSGHDMHAWLMHWNKSIMSWLNPSSRIATSECNDCTRRCVACGRRDNGHCRGQHAFRAHENKTRTGMKYSWETRDWNPVRRVRYPAIPLADVVKLGITRDSYSRIAVRIRRPLRHSSIMIWGQNKFLVMWTYGNMRSYGIVFLPRIKALRRSLEPLIVVRIHGKEPFWTNRDAW